MTEVEQFIELYETLSEKIPRTMEEELDESARKYIPRHRRKYNRLENETFSSNAVHMSDSENGLVPNINLTENAAFQRRAPRTDEIEYETSNLTLKHIPSTYSLYSRGSRNRARHSPPGSFRSLRNSTILNAPLSRKEKNKDGINIIMLIGFGISIAIGSIFNIMEVYLKWFQLKFGDFQLHIFDGKSIHGFYLHEESITKKILYSPISALFLVLQSILYALLISLDFLKKPAPKTLVSHVMSRYINE